MNYFTLKVIEVIKEVPNVITIRFKQPALKKIRYKAGQYLTIVVNINGRKYMRPYSFSSAPNIDPHLEITLKRIPDGVVSNYLYDHVKIDDLIQVMEPMGNFVFDPEDHIKSDPDHVMLWAAGTGITPLMSIIKTIIHTSPTTKIELFYCNRNPEHTIFKTELEYLQQQYSERFIVYNFYTKLPEDIWLNYHIPGRIDEEKITLLLSKHTNLDRTYHYVCGPTGLTETVRSSLKSLDISSENIMSEEFEVMIDPEAFDDIETRNITFVNSVTNVHVEVIKGKSILYAGLDALIDLPYSCQTGTCMLCKAKLLSGKVKVIGVDKLPADLRDDDCLLCCSYPFTDDVKIMTN